MQGRERPAEELAALVAVRVIEERREVGVGADDHVTAAATVASTIGTATFSLIDDRRKFSELCCQWLDESFSKIFISSSLGPVADSGRVRRFAVPGNEDVPAKRENDCLH